MRASRLFRLTCAASLCVGGLLSNATAGQSAKPAVTVPPVVCPTVARTGMALPAGARVFGRLTAVAAPLTNGSLTGEETADADPKRGFNEDEADDINASGATFTYGPGNSESLMCRYGRGPLPLNAQALVLIPLPRLYGICRFKQPRGAAPASMICRRDPSGA